MKISQYIWIACCFTSLILGVSSFNLDTKFPIIFKGKPESFFGLTVALHYNRDGAMALIGAPKANSSADQVYEPGALYQCDIKHQNSNCREIVLDKIGNSYSEHRNSIFSYHEMKNNMWLGVSLDILQNSARNDVVTCGHLWQNQLYAKNYLPNGVCYVINEDLDANHVVKLLPLVERSRATKNRYEVGQVGTSATFSGDGKYLLLGAPGYYFWTGTVVSYDLYPGRVFQEYMRPTILEPPFDQNVSPESYIGYSATSGNFFDDKNEYVAVGAPRDGWLNGRVYVYEPRKSARHKRIVTYQRLEGSQLGEYFGACVLGVDLNNDSYTDLLVGSPFYSSHSGVDEGKAYVFISNGIGLLTFAELFGKSTSNARFGTSIANVGDINQDGFNDVAIGAPYENEKGVVYIYLGSSIGLNVKYAQRICAAEIDSSLFGFGIGISRGFDVDSNQYPDVLIGAYASANAVLFRARPIQQLHSKIAYSPMRINMNNQQCSFRGQNMSCVDITACLRYTGKHVPLNLNFQHDIVAEQNQYNVLYLRGFFIHDTIEPSNVVTHTSKLSVGKDYCFKRKLHIRSDIKDRVTPISILYRYRLIEDTLKSFNKTFPITDPSSTNEYLSLITFQTGCGSDDKCQSDLSLDVNILATNASNIFVIGERTTLILAIKVTNLGEPAYLSELLIYLPPELPSINHDICTPLTDQRRNASLLCNLGNPLKIEKNAKILIKLDLTKVPTDKKELFVVFEALTASNDINQSNNYVKIPLRFKAMSDISVTGSPAQEQVIYDRLSAESHPVTITHSYFVMNHGPSPVQVVNIALFVPFSLKGNDFVTFTSVETESGKSFTVPATCNDTYLDLKSILLEDRGIITDDSNIEEETYNFNTTFDFKVPSKRQRKRSIKRHLLKKGKNFVIDCETTKCVAVQCSASPFLDVRKFAKITITIQVNMDVINDFRSEWNRLQFVTRAAVEVRDGEHLSELEYNHHPDQTTVKTTVVSSARPAPEEPSEWIIFASIGVGTILFLIILVLLIKFGFFKRQKKELMDKIKRETNMEVNVPVTKDQEELS